MQNQSEYELGGENLETPFQRSTELFLGIVFLTFCVLGKKILHFLLNPLKVLLYKDFYFENLVSKRILCKSNIFYVKWKKRSCSHMIYHKYFKNGVFIYKYL